MAKILVALGGNALGESPKEQEEILRDGVKNLVDLIQEGHEIAIVHGNGPQVGMINLAMENSYRLTKSTPEIPFPECGAMSQGYIGYHIQNALVREIKSRNIKKEVATIVTQVVVDKNDKAMDNPSKPIGKFYSEDEAREIERDKGYTFKEDSGRGWRRVVASPKPIDIVEKGIINLLIDAGKVVISAGGGGIPVVVDGHGFRGVPAVIDKDLVSQVLAREIDADILLILTAVDKVAINFGKPDQKDLDEISIEEAKSYARDGQFGEGSMLPKIEAALSFAELEKGKKAIIGSLSNTSEVIKGRSGTVIYNK